jgi:Ca2+/Na+ antiporter
MVLLRFVLVLFLLREMNVMAVDMSTEGFFNVGNQPGSPDDPRGIPNIPYSTDTNRFSDGVTSDATVDITSPHFPIYHGYLSDANVRYQHYIAYAKSAAAQGVATYGAGDAVKEAARLLLLNISGSHINDYKPNATFPVYAAIKWNPSDFAIQEGEHYKIEVLGDQSGYSHQMWRDGGIRVNAEGYTSHYDAVSNCYVGMGRCRSYLKKKRRLQTANWMALACSIGQFVIPLQAIEAGSEKIARYMPLDEAALAATIFSVGQSLTFRAIYTGTLICFANDAQTEYWNNQGHLSVTVTRESWPPSNNTYYQDLSVASCDSALSVYANYSLYHSNYTAEEIEAINFKCNPNSGGSGWSTVDIYSDTTRYGSGAPAYLTD